MVTDRKTMPWSRILAEGAVIVVSILLAFWIDAWWDGRTDRSEEREILLGLEIEFFDLSDRLHGELQFTQDGIDLLDKMLSDSVADMDLWAIESALSHAILVGVLDRGGALEALVNSGRLERISDHEIRERLIKLPARLEDIHVDQVSQREFSVHLLQPLLAKYGFPRAACYKVVLLVCPRSGPVPPEYLELAKDQEVRALLLLRRNWISATQSDYQRAINEVVELLAMIRAQLEAFEEH